MVARTTFWYKLELNVASDLAMIAQIYMMLFSERNQEISVTEKYLEPTFFTYLFTTLPRRYFVHGSVFCSLLNNLVRTWPTWIQGTIMQGKKNGCFRFALVITSQNT